MLELKAGFTGYIRSLNADIIAAWRTSECPNMSMFSGRIKRNAKCMASAINKFRTLTN